jgi:osmotically-inducible protein OsmY
MGWLDRLFGHHDAPAADKTGAPAQGQPIPPERVGLDGSYDQSGLAKRVAKAFDDGNVDDHSTVWIAQHGATVVLKGKVHSKDALTALVAIAKKVDGAQAVETDQVEVV